MELAESYAGEILHGRHDFDPVLPGKYTLHLEATSEGGKPFNVVPPEENYRIRELAEIVGETVAGCEVTFAAGAGPDPSNYRVSGAKLQALFPQFEYRWNARLGARELADAYRAAGLDRATFEGPRFKRLGWIRKLLAEGSLAGDLRWNAAPAALAGH